MNTVIIQHWCVYNKYQLFLKFTLIQNLISKQKDTLPTDSDNRDSHKPLKVLHMLKKHIFIFPLCIPHLHRWV